MTKYSKPTFPPTFTLEKIWENRLINQVVLGSNDFTPSDEGHGILLATKGGNVLYDLRLSKERCFLGHYHPLWLKVFSHSGSVTLPGSTLKLSPSDSIVDEIQYLLGTEANGILENPFLFYQSKKLRTQLPWAFCFTGSDCYFNPGASSTIKEPNLFEIFIYYFLELYDEILYQKNLIDFAIIDDYIHARSAPLRRLGRYIQTPKIEPERLMQQGIMHTPIKESDHSFFSYPFACTKDEILDSLKRIESVL